MTSIFSDYGKEHTEQFKTEYDLSRVDNWIEWAKRDIRSIQEFLVAVTAQKAVIERTAFLPEVRLTKEHNYSTNHINYRVNSYLVPQVPGGDKHIVCPVDFQNKIIPGGDVAHRKEAVALAQELSAKYGNCPIVGNAAGMVKPVKDVIKL